MPRAIRAQRAVLLLVIAVPESLAHAQLQRLTYDNPGEDRRVGFMPTA